MTRFDRRRFLQWSLGTGVGLGLGLRPMLGLADAERSPVVVTIMLRGALDGLSVLIPHRDPGYRQARRATRIAAPGASDGALALTDELGLHPSLSPLEPLYRDGKLAFVAGFGSPLASRSHFEAQRLMELGTLETARPGEGFLNRVAAQLSETPGRPTAVAASPGLPLLLRGRAPALSLGPLVSASGSARRRRIDSLSQLYPEEGDAVMSAGHQSLSMLSSLEPALGTPSNSTAYPRGRTSRSLANISRLIRADLGIPLYYAEVGGWDSHANQGGASGQLSRKLNKLAIALAAFDEDLGEARRDVVVVCITEFGRTVRENGSRGTDHGHGSVAMVFGGSVAGGRVLGGLPRIEEEALYEGRDLPVQVDYRDLYSEIIQRHLGVSDGAPVFSDFAPQQSRFPGVMRRT